jgi:hypothetical protein
VERVNPALRVKWDKGVQTGERNIMARLIIEALAEDTIASPNNREQLYVVASVTATSGTPITGLSAANFNIQAVIVAPFGAQVQFGPLFIAPHPGVYGLGLVPVSNYVWKQGVYLFYVVVNRGTDQGQTLLQVMLD